MKTLEFEAVGGCELPVGTSMGHADHCDFKEFHVAR